MWSGKQKTPQEIQLDFADDLIAKVAWQEPTFEPDENRLRFRGVVSIDGEEWVILLKVPTGKEQSFESITVQGQVYRKGGGLYHTYSDDAARIAYRAAEYAVHHRKDP